MRGALKLTLLVFFFTMLSFNGYASEKLIFDGSTGVKPLVESLVKHYKQIRPNIVVDMGTGLNPQKRIQAVIDKNINVAMASHGLDMQRISQLGLKAHRIAKMAVVMGVNHTVGMKTISDRELCDIYSGKIDNWRNIGGKELPIVPMLRPFSEVDTEVIRAHIPCFSEVQFLSDILTFEKSGKMAKSIARTSGAIGMTTLVRVAKSQGEISALSMNDISPNTNNLLSGAYPFTRDSFLITSSKPTAEVAAFLTFVRSERGKAVIIANNAVPAEQ
jgi:phosphate transport system substrate-binding protein